MTVFAQDANVTGDGVKTIGYRGDPGDGTDVFYTNIKSGALGARTDAAVTDPAPTTTSILSLLKGILTRLGTTASGIFKAEDSAHASADLLVPIAAVRQDTLAALAGTTGDYTVITTDALGRLRIAGDNGAGLPIGATAVAASSGNVANAAAVATIAAGGASVTNYLTGFTVTAAGATAAAVVSVTVAGLLGGTQTFTFGVPAGAAAMATPLVVEFGFPFPASDANTAIVVTCPALGAGNTNASVTARGFKI